MRANCKRGEEEAPQELLRARLSALAGSKFRDAASPSGSWAGGRSLRKRRVSTGGSPTVCLDWTRVREPDEAPNPTAAALGALKTRRVELDRQAPALDAEERKTGMR